MLSTIYNLLRRAYKKITRVKVLRRIIVSGEKQIRKGINHNDHIVKFINGSDEKIFDFIHEHRYEIFKGFNPNDKVLIKININTADDYPASTDPKMLSNLITCLNNVGISNIEIGDCSAYTRLPSRRVFKKTKLYDEIDGRAKIRFFDEEKWYKVKIGGRYLSEITLPEAIYQADKVIYLSNLKTHRITDFSFSMKLAVGNMHPRERIEMHKDHVQEKIAEIMLAFEPDLILIDARKCFITGGPDYGKTARADTILYGHDLLECDLEAYKLLYNVKKENKCIEQFSADPFMMKQLKHARKILTRD